MQALIDFDGWRKWKDFSQIQQNGEGDGENGDKKKKGKGKNKGNRVSVGSSAGLAVGGS